MNRAMKDTGVEWIGEIPESWEVVPVKRKYKNAKEIVGDREPDFQRLALTLNGVVKRSKESAEGLQPEKLNTYQIVYNQELLFKLIDLENVKTSRVGYSPYTGIVSPIYIRLINPQESKYGYYYFKNLWHQEVFNYLGSGVRSSLNAGDLLNMPYLIVPKLEQQKIVAFLDNKISQIDVIIANTKQSIVELKKYKQALISETVTKGLNPDIKMTDSGIEWIGEIPEHWKVCKLKYILSERSIKSETGEEEPLSMSQKYGLIKTKDMDLIPNMTNSYVGNKIVEINDLVFNKLKAHLGVFSVSNYEGIVSPDYAVYYPKEEVNVKFLEYVFKTANYITEFKKRSRGIAAGLTRLYTNDLFAIKCGIPNLKEQTEIVDYINQKSFHIDSLIVDKEKMVQELENYKKSIIYEYVTGKKEV